MSKFVTKEQLKKILKDPNQTGSYISLKNNKWTCLKKDHDEIKLMTTTSIIVATKFFRGIT